jgi:glycine oxidase
LATATEEFTESYDVAVVTTGAWIGELVPSVRVRPIRGQSGRFPGVRVRHVVRWGGQHALPDGDDTLVGGTVEEAGFDLSTTDEARQELSVWCARLFEPTPSLGQLRAGLRPKPRRGRPVITPLGTETLFVASGHYKNGILMAPHTGQVLARWIMKGSPGRDMSPFTIER